MSKILKNTTTSNISIGDVGVTVIASSSYIVQSTDYLIFSASNDIFTYIDSGAIVVNDGLIDLNINEGKALIRFPDDALSVRYNNSNTDIEAKNVQYAIDELSFKVKFNRILTGYNEFEVLVDSDGNVLTEE